MLMSRPVLKLVFVLSMSAQFAGAQSTPPTRDGTTVSGVVHDSIGGGFLADATVQLVSRDDPARFLRNATSDSLGRFSLADVPLGRYSLGFFHPLLDSLGIEAPPRDVNVDSYSPVIADLAVPSPVRLRSAICRNTVAGDSVAVIIGTVRDAQDGSPAANVNVTGEWLEFSLNRLGMARQRARRATVTTDNGWFALCDVPSSGTVALVATRGADSTGIVEVQMPPEKFLRRELYLGPAQTDSVAVTSQSGGATATSKRRIHVGNVKLSGTIVTVAGDQPLAGAQVGIVDGPQTRTNERGEFTIANAPPGTRMLEVRALGYFPVQRHVNVVNGGQPVRVALSTFKAMLDTVRITASRDAFGPDNGGFARRRRMAQGNFITPADIIRFPVQNTSDIFRRVPAVRVEMDDYGSKYLTIRGCRPAIFINGANYSFMDTDDIDSWVYPRDIKGIEVYSEATAPSEFTVGLGGCGSIVIWTK